VSRIAFASTYPPRVCGIATFTSELARVIPGREVIALRRPDDHARPQPEVHHVIGAEVRADHVRVARSLGDHGVSLVSIQHEYGIWGGNDGEHVLDFLAALQIPAVATLHTVLRHPSSSQRRIMRGLLEETAGVTVMSQAAATLLAEAYGAGPDRVEVIPHGVPDLPFVEPHTVKPSVGLEGRSVILSFGLLGPSKGCEAVIEAMPAIVRAVPNATYVILGVTHPELVRTQGERYRRGLEALTASLGMGAHVLFVDRFVGRVELGRWLEAADVFVTPYPNLEQIVSGTLSYAMAAGKASVSTPYRYAAEILAGGRGVLVPPRSREALTDALISLLLDPQHRAAIAQRAYDHGRGMVWSHVATMYTRLFSRIHTVTPASTVLAVPVHSA
jgi:glycosyltransferase involved in cell wall biosynthesis